MVKTAKSTVKHCKKYSWEIKAVHVGSDGTFSSAISILSKKGGIKRNTNLRLGDCKHLMKERWKRKRKKNRRADDEIHL